MNELAMIIGYIVIIGGGITLTFCLTWWFMMIVLSLPVFKPKVLHILKLGTREYMKERNNK